MKPESTPPSSTGPGAEPKSTASPSTGDPAPPTTSADLLAKALAERDENYDRFLRTQAEMDNVRKRMQRERDEERRYAPLSVIRDLLPAMDNLQRAIDAARDQESIGELCQGVSLVLKQIEGVIHSHGAAPIPTQAQPFDPNLHEALQQVPTDDFAPMTIVQELERGYTLHDRLIRPSKVIVAARPIRPNGTNNEPAVGVDDADEVD